METAMKTMTDKKRGWGLLSLGLDAFAGLGLEVVYAFLLEPLLYGASMEGVEYLADDCTLDYHLYFLGTGGGLGTADGGKEVWPEAV